MNQPIEATIQERLTRWSYRPFASAADVSASEAEAIELWDVLRVAGHEPEARLSLMSLGLRRLTTYRAMLTPDGEVLIEAYTAWRSGNLIVLLESPGIEESRGVGE